MTTRLPSQQINLINGQLLQIDTTAPQTFILAPYFTTQAFVVVRQGQDLMAKFTDGSELVIKGFYANNGVLQMTSDSDEVISISAETLLTQTLNSSDNADNENKKSDPLEINTPSTNDSNLTSHHIVYSQGKPEALTQLLETWRVTDGSNQLALAQQLEATEPAAGSFLLTSLLGLGGAALAVGSSGGGESVAADITAPATPDAQLTQQGTDNQTNNASLTAPTNTEVGATLAYRWKTSAGEFSEWTSNYEVPTAEGAYVIEIRQTDTAGNVSESQVIEFTLDTTVPTTPTVELNTPDTGVLGDNITKDNQLILTQLDSDATWQYSTNGGVNWSDSLDSSITSFRLEDGAYDAQSIQVKQIDQAGNESTVSMISARITIDTTAPTIPNLALSSIGSDGFTNDASLTAPTNTEARAELAYRWKTSTGEFSDWASNYEVPTVEGPYVIEIRQTDTAGNVSETQVIEFTLDTTAPEIITEIVHAIYENNQEVTTLVTQNSNEAVTWNITGGLDSNQFELNGNKLTFKNAINYEKLTDNNNDGTYILEVTATDAAGNSSAQKINVEVKNVTEVGIHGLRVEYAPNGYETILGAGQLNAPLLTGFGPKNTEITLTLGDVQHLVNSNDDGYWEYPITPGDITAMGIGEEIISASYTDLDGVTDSAGFDLTVNAQATTTLNQRDDSNSVYVNSLIYSGSGWENTTITYSFNNTGDLKSQWTKAEQNAFADALQTFSNVANVTFVEGIYTDDKNTGTNMVLHKNPASDFEKDIAAWFEFPLADTHNQVNGNFNYDESGDTGADKGSFNFMLYIHELGHGLGLLHPFNEAKPFPGVVGPNDIDDNNLNQKVWTVMAYRDGWANNTDGFPATPMFYDIAALQLMYGANDNYMLGDNIYKLPTKSQPGFSCIWDAGGIDTISNKDNELNSFINLSSYPLAGGEADYDFISFTYTVTTTNNGDSLDWNAGLTIANGCNIENAIGGKGADDIYGNALYNMLLGGDGNDYLDGKSGNDQLSGELGDDTLYGGLGDDFLKGGLGDDFLYGGLGSDILLGGLGADFLTGGSGDDKLTGGQNDDVFVFNTELGNVDTITDFSINEDLFFLDHNIFTSLILDDGLLSKFLNTDQFVSSNTGSIQALNADDFLLYDQNSGHLYYDADGSGTNDAAILFASLTGSPDDLTSKSFAII
jgi:serralysin